MRTTVTSMAVVVLWCGMVVPRAHAQKGMGERTGVARQAAKPEVRSLSGKVLATETGPCKTTTGRADVGSHVLLKTPNGKEFNVHLGPSAAVAYIIDQLPIGKKVTVQAFRTTKMPKNHYVAQSLTFSNITIRLRDESLRPFWAGRSTVSHGRGGPQWPPGKGEVAAAERRPRYEPGWGGPGRGYGRRGPGAGHGRGPGWGSGRGYGRCPAWAAERGADFGQR